MKQFWSHSGCKEKDVAGHSVKKIWKSWLAMLSLLLVLGAGQPAWAWSVWTVDSILDTAGSASDGDHTLRWAVEQAADGDRIEFHHDLIGQDILLERPIITAKHLEFANWHGMVGISAAPGTSGSLFQSNGGGLWDFGQVAIQGAQGAGVEMNGVVGSFKGMATHNRGGGIRADIIGNFSGSAMYNSLTVVEGAGASASGGGVSADLVGTLQGGDVIGNTASATATTGSAAAKGGGMDAILISSVVSGSSYARNTAYARATSGTASASGGGMSAFAIHGTGSGWFDFTENRAEAFSESGSVSAEGGGLYLIEGGDLDARFTDNSAVAVAKGSASASAAGGGMSGFFIREGSADSSFNGNLASATTQAGAASAHGGGLYAGQLDSLDGWFRYNRAEAHSENGSAEAYGGGAFSEGVKELSASFHGNIAEAAAGYGGTAAAYGGAFAGSGDITIAGGSYQHNHALAYGADATAKGGALYLRNDEFGSPANVTFDASLGNILFNNNSVAVNGKTTRNDIHFAGDTAFTITGNKASRSVSIYDGIHAEGGQGTPFSMTKKGDVAFNWGGVNVFDTTGSSTVSFVEGASHIMSDFTADAVNGNLNLHLGANHTLNLDLHGRDNTQAFFSGLMSLTLEEGTRLTASIYKHEPLSPWENLGKWLFAEGTGWSVDQLNTMGILTSINGIWYSGGTFLTDAKGLWLNLEKLTNTSATPIPGAVWLLGSGLAGFAALRRRMNAA